MRITLTATIVVIVLILTLCSLIFAIYRKHRKAALIECFISFLSISLVGTFYFTQRSVTNWHNYVVVQYTAYAIALWIIVLCFVVAYSILIRIFLQKKIVQIATSISFVVVIVISIYGCCYGRYDYSVERINLEFTDLPPSFDGATIAVISDLHLGCLNGNGDMLKPAVDSILSLNADFVVCLGDWVNNFAHEFEGCLSQLQRLNSCATMISVEGNHDLSEYVDWPSNRDKTQNDSLLTVAVTSCGFRYLRDETMFVGRGCDSILFVGSRNHSKSALQQNSQLIDSCFTIWLQHEPGLWQGVAESKSSPNLTLSGHTHGGQFAIGSANPIGLFERYSRGLYKENDKYLYVNSGLGVNGLPIRIGAKPEITLITLRKRD